MHDHAIAHNWCAHIQSFLKRLAIHAARHISFCAISYIYTDQQVTDIYATATDYDPLDEMTKMFFATVQNKLHYAVH